MNLSRAVSGYYAMSTGRWAQQLKAGQLSWCPTKKDLRKILGPAQLFHWSTEPLTTRFRPATLFEKTVPLAVGAERFIRYKAGFILH